MLKKGKEVDPRAAGKQRRPAAEEFALLPKVFYTSTAQEKSMQNGYEAQLNKQRQRLQLRRQLDSSLSTRHALESTGRSVYSGAHPIIRHGTCRARPFTNHPSQS